MDLDGDGHGCHAVWTSDARAPSVVPKLSLRAGLLYTYTKPKRDDMTDAWYLTALDFDTGKTVYSRLAGTGFGLQQQLCARDLSRRRHRLRGRARRGDHVQGRAPVEPR